MGSLQAVANVPVLANSRGVNYACPRVFRPRVLNEIVPAFRPWRVGVPYSGMTPFGPFYFRYRAPPPAKACLLPRFRGVVAGLWAQFFPLA